MGMKCVRCSGLMIKDEFNCYFQWLTGTRCLNCGYVKLDDEQRITQYNNQEKTKQVDESELYKIRNRSRLRNTTLRTTTY